jgi:hypothetical protein
LQALQIFSYHIFCDDAAVGANDRGQPHNVIAAARTNVRDCHPGFDAKQAHELGWFTGIVALLFVVPDRTSGRDCLYPDGSPVLNQPLNEAIDDHDLHGQQLTNNLSNIQVGSLSFNWFGNPEAACRREITATFGILGRL